MKEIDELIEISRRYGSDKNYVIAGGGNTSYKNDEYVWIKGSGTSLAVIDENGFVKLDRKKLKLIGKKEYPHDVVLREEQVKNDLAAAIDDKPGKRPSVETSLHELLDYAFVVHTHPSKVNGLTCSVRAEEKTKEIFGDEALFIRYTDPGYTLFAKVRDEVIKYGTESGSHPHIVFLENHGVFVAADTTREIDDIYRLINEKLDKKIKIIPGSSEGQVENLSFELKGEKKVMLKKNSPLIEGFVKNKKEFAKVSVAFTPDNIVYCKAYYPFATNASEMETAVSGLIYEKGYWPRVIGINGEGLCVLEDSIKSAYTVLEVFEDMLKTAVYAENFGGAKPMTPEQIAFIDNWEVENYRRKVARE